MNTETLTKLQQKRYGDLSFNIGKTMRIKSNRARAIVLDVFFSKTGSESGKWMYAIKIPEISKANGEFYTTSVPVNALEYL